MKQMERTVIVDALKRTDIGAEINIKGWVRTRRGNKNVSFIALNDGSTINNIQIVVDMAKFDEDALKPITTGACINVNGKLVESMGQGQTVEVQADEIEIYGTADPEKYKLQKIKEIEKPITALFVVINISFIIFSSFNISKRVKKVSLGLGNIRFPYI